MEELKQSVVIDKSKKIKKQQKQVFNNQKSIQKKEDNVEKNKQEQKQVIPQICLGQLTQDYAEQLIEQYGNILSLEQILQLDKDGYLVINDILNQQECQQAIHELWDILEAVPNKPNYRLRRPQQVLGALSKQQQKEYSQNWVPWKSYGMLSEPHVFHTNTLWRLRQNERLYSIFCLILQTEKLWASIDRGSVKLPNEGLEEFNHWDFDPWHPCKATVQGIVNLSTRYFRCVPGSNTEEWHEAFKNAYNYLSSETPRSQVQIDKNKDPWFLGQILELNSKQGPKTNYNCIRNIECPPGSIVLFSQRTMHSVSRNNSNNIHYGLYLTFIEAGNKDTHAVVNKKAASIHAVEGHTERGDRIRSYQQGTAPYKYACGAGIFQYIIPRTIENFKKKRLESSFSKHPNTGNLTILEPMPENYNPPELTQLGRKLLGLDLYEDMGLQPLFINNNL